MSVNALFFGCESFRAKLEDEDVVVDHESTDIEAIDDTNEAAVADDDADQVVDKIEDTVEAADEMCSTLDRVMAIGNYVARNGVDRSLMTLQNYDGIITSAEGMGIRLRYSDIPARGDPRSHESMIAMEGISETANSIWEWIKKMCRRIRDFLQELWAKFLNLFSSQKTQIKRLRAILRNRRNKDHDDLENISVTIRKPTGDSEIVANGTIKVKAVLKIKGAKDIDDIGSKILHQTTAAKFGDSMIEQAEVFKKEVVEATIAATDKFSSKLDDVEFEDDEYDSNNPVGSASDYLTAAEKLITESNELKTESKNIDSRLKDVDKLANSTTLFISTDPEDVAQFDKKASAPLVKEYIQALNKRTSLLSKVLRLSQRTTAAFIGNASRLISKGTVSKSK